MYILGPRLNYNESEVGLMCIHISLHQVQVLKELEQALGSPLDTQPQAPPSKPLVIVISGPSGVGKDAVIKVT